jgi:2-amino-4-hydroxy-6-hydroxymethyldihydropteridine diphosphokinase
MNTGVIGAGSNIRPRENIKKARDILTRECRLVGESEFVKTDPVGFQGQDDFMNGVFVIETDLDYEECREYLKSVEDRLGRKRTHNKYGPRTIDLDITVWNNKITDNDFYSRDFLKKAVLEVLPDLDY